MLFIVRINLKLHSIIAKIMNVKLIILTPRYYDDYSNRSIKLFRQTSTQLLIKIFSKETWSKTEKNIAERTQPQFYYFHRLHCETNLENF